MPSKRTNDSVEQILEDLNREQAAKGIRDGVTDRNVDEILRSIPRSTAPMDDITATLGPIPEADMPKVEVSADLKDPESRFSTQTINDLLGDLPIFQNSGTPAVPPPVRRPQAPPQQTRTTPAAKAPARQPQTAARTQQPDPQPQSSARAEQPAPQAQTAARPQQPAPQRRQPVREEPPRDEPPRTGATQTLRPDPQPQPPAGGTTTVTGTNGTTVDTTRTGVIGKLLVQLGGEEDKTQLSQRKNQFKKFFGESIAVVPGQDGKLPAQPKKRKRNIFGFGGDTGEITDEFVPINVSLAGRHPDVTAPQPAPEDQPQPEPEEQEEPQVPARKKRGFFDSLFGSRNNRYEDTADLDLSGEAQSPQEAEPQPEPGQESRPEPQPEKYVYHSKYAGRRRVHDTPADTFSSLDLNRQQEEPARQPEQPEPQPQPEPVSRWEPEPEPQPAEEATRQVPVQPEQPRRKKRDTLEFTPGKKPHAAPERQQPQVDEFRAAEPAGEPMSTRQDTLTSGFTIDMTRREEREDTHDFIAHARPQTPQPAPAPGAENTDTITGQVRLTPPPQDPDRTVTGQISIGAEPRPAESTADFALDFLDNQPQQRPNTEQFVRDIANTLNTLPDEEENPYAKAADRLTHPEEDEEDGQPRRSRRRRRKRADGPRLDGTPEDEREPENEGPFAEAHPHRPAEYEAVEDAPRVRRELDNRVLYLTVSTVVSGVAALVMIYLGIAATGSVLPMPAMLVPTATAETAAAAAGAMVSASAAPLMTVLLVLLLAVCGLNWKTMFCGLRGLVQEPTADTMPALAAVGALIQLLVFLIQPGWYLPSSFCLLAGPAALLLCGNAVGKQIDACTTRANFDLVSAGVDHAVAYRLRDATVLRTVTRGLGEPKPNLLVSRPTLLLKHFLAGSGAHRTSDKNQQQFSWVVGVCALLSLVFTLAYRQDPGMAFTAFAVVLCLGAPLSGTLISAIPARLMQRSAARVGAVIPGWKDIRQLGRINVIQITAKDLFPTGCVTLAGIRAIDNKELEKAITNAASIMAQSNGPLRDVFLGMVGDNRKLLTKVDDLKTEYGRGYVGWINGQRVLVGNRALMEAYQIRIPDAAFEARHSVNQRRIVYLACSGSLMAMFQVGYQRDPDTAAVLESLRQVGMSMIVDCDDFNCDVRLVEAVYGLPSGSVKVLNAAEREALTPATAWLPESDGNMLHLGSFASFVGGLEAASSAAEGEYRGSIVLAASVLAGCLMAVIMSLAGGIASLPLLILVLYQIGWSILTLAFPLTRRY